MSSLKIEAPFAETKNTPVVEKHQKADNPAKLELPAATTYRMGSIGFMSRNQARAIEEVARARTDSLIVNCPKVEAFNGRAAMIGMGEAEPNISGLNKNDEPRVRTIMEGLTVHVTPAFVDDDVVRLQCVSSFEGIAEMQPVDPAKEASESPQRNQAPATASSRVQTTVELRNDQTLFLTGITTTHNGKRQAVLVVLDVIPVSLKPLTALIRLDESFIPSPDMVLTGDTVLAYVADKKITLAHVLIGALSQLDKDTRLTPDQRQQVLRAGVEQRLPAYLYDEVVLHEFQRTVPPEKQTAIRNSVEPLFTVFLKQIRNARQAKDAEDLERLLAADGSSAESLHESFVRRQLVEGYVKSFPAESPIRDAAAIESHCRQLLFEARLRQKVSLNADDAWLPSELISLEEKCGIRISRNAIYEVDRSVTVTAHLLDRPLLDVIKAIVEPHGFQVAVGQQEVVLTAKPREQPMAVAVEPGSFRVEALPLPDSIRKSSDPLVKLVWDAREASRRRLLMTDQRTPWQLMNGLMALRGDFVLRDGDEVVNGLEWVQSGPKIPGDPWFQKTEHGGQPDPQPAPVWFDDHAQQFVATLAMNDVPLSAEFRTKDGPITMGDMIKHLQMTVSKKNLSPWTLCALSKHLSPDAKWVNADSEEWSLEKLLQIEVDKHDQATQPMVLFAIACARNQYLKTGQRLRGVWQQADQEIHAVIQHDLSMSPRYRPLFVPHRYPHVKGETRLPHIQPVSSTDPASQKKLFLEALRMSPYQPQHFDTDTFGGVPSPRGQMLMFFITAVPDEQLQAVWLRNAIEVAANGLLADWGNAEIRSPFYETTQALSLYLERVAVAGAATTIDQTAPFTVQVRGRVRIPGIWKAPAGDSLRVTDAIQLSGGAKDETAKTVYVIRNRGKNPQPTILQIGYNGAERGAEPNIFLAPGDEVLVQSPEFVKQPIADSIRLDDSFVLSPDMPITGSSVIVYVNDRQITVERFIGSLWSRLEETPEITETLKRRVALEAIASGLPEFVFQQLIEHYFYVDTSESLDWLEDDSMPLREVTVKQFAEILEKVSKFDADPRTQARTLLALLARASSVALLERGGNPAFFTGRQKRVDGYVRGMHSDSIESNKSIVIRVVQELLTTACLRNAISLDFTNASLSDVVQVLE
ncbi:MAG: hypothetical protein H7Z17_03445, partial [Fuerstia sp.]|nr:hypothetical protein [Fuerstiella sp.]